MMQPTLFLLVFLPIISGAALVFVKQELLRKNITLAVSIISFAASIYLFIKPDFSLNMHLFAGFNLTLGLDNLSRIILAFINLFALLVCLYSRSYIEKKGAYFSYFSWLLAFANLEILATDFITFIFAWGAVITVLYALLRQDSAVSARKSLVILGFSYLCFIVAASLFVSFTGSSSMFSGSKVLLNQPICWVAFVLMLAGGLAKTGSGPFHTWIPQASETAPVTVMAILPASLDKLLGVYILSRICLDFFILTDFARALLLIIGSLTIMFAVLMALIQHDLRKLLAYHAVSQAGYMVLGLGTGNPLGIIGAVFHMFNNAIYKNGLFLVGGAVQKRRQTFKLENLGGLARYMPLTFIAGLVFSLSISGIPPFSGFASKWLLYQGAIFGFANTNNLLMRAVFIFSLIAALFGSALTLASFIKFIHAIFLGEPAHKESVPVREAPAAMVIPLLLLAGLCVLLGVGAQSFVKNFIGPSFEFSFSYPLGWDSILVFVIMLAAVLLGALIWFLMTNKKVREDGYFVGGESSYSRPLFPATEFYKTIEDIPAMKFIYRIIRFERLDLDSILANSINSVSRGLYGLLTFGRVAKKK